MSMTTSQSRSDVQIIGVMNDEYAAILTPGAIDFVQKLATRFSESRKQLLGQRVEKQKQIDAGWSPDFLDETKEVRESSWSISPLPRDLQDRRVEITGPVDRKMMINALNSGAKVFMADLEDSNSPTWENSIQGQINLQDAVTGTISFVSPQGKQYLLNKETATLIVRPRGWHLIEKHVLIHGEPISASLFDFGLYFYHNAKSLIEKGTGPYFYLPKLESHLEARLWNEVFVFAQEELGIPLGTIKATVLLETILAAFEMDEILYELRDHSAGLNCGRWDYIFSFLKKFSNRPDCILPDRELVTMTTPFMRAYSLLCIQTCHRRNAPAIGGMAAQIPVKNDELANEEAFHKVRSDKEREAKDGHDGTWVAHPALVPVALEVFNEYMPEANQINKKLIELRVLAKDLLEVPKGEITEQGLRTNISVGVQYLESWLRGKGAVPINNLMEDAATAEISRAQVWQWIRHPAGVVEGGRKITITFFQELLEDELDKLKRAIGEEGFNAEKYSLAAKLFAELTLNDEFVEFLTLPGYAYLD
jgi:malate synthase